VVHFKCKIDNNAFEYVVMEFLGILVCVYFYFVLCVRFL